MGLGSGRHAFADSNGYPNSCCDSHGYFHGNGNSYSHAHSDSYSYFNRNGYCNCYGYSDNNQHGCAYCYSLRYAAMHKWVVGGRSFPQRPGSLGGCLFLWGLGPKVLRHGRALGRYSRKRLRASV